ncbi:heavy metal-binding domain-containing protein [Streptacidiphilus sp. MAP12-33]|uniref:heavy metal-binding domain-containing protein n=1 Tax=Streptacidiphilus sp. MAP12-33 TaxID=3156266 RepID=UPI003518E7A7
MLPPRGFAAVGAAGFEPVGRARGTGSYHVEVSGETWNWHAHDCGYSSRPTGPAPVVVSGSGGSSTVLVEVLEGARHRALERLRGACAQLGGHGVVGAQVGIAPSTVTWLGADVTVSGTVVRARGVADAVALPFVTHLDGADFAKLLLAGWVPVDLLVGQCVGVRHEDRTSWNQQRSAANEEMHGWTELLGRVREGARARLHEQAAERGGDGALLNGDEVAVWEQRCQRPGTASAGRREPTDKVARCTVVGTSVARFASGPAGPAGPAGVRPLTVLPLRGA